MDFQTIATTVAGVLTPLGTAAIGLWRWIVKQLEECKAKHAESLNKIDNLHTELRILSQDVGNLKGQLTVYRKEQTDNKTVDNA